MKLIRRTLTLLPVALTLALLAHEGDAVSANEEPLAAPLTKPGICGLHGKVRVVKAFGKYKVRAVDAFPDIKVQVVAALPDQPGQWQMVDALEDFTIQFVDVAPDFTIQYVDFFPGCDSKAGR